MDVDPPTAPRSPVARGRCRLSIPVFASALLGGCTAMTGGPSLTLLSRADLRGSFEPVAEVVEVEECATNVLFLALFGNARPTHEGVVDLALDEYDADVLLDAEVTTTRYPFVLFNQTCTKVRGVPARARLGPSTSPPTRELDAAPDPSTDRPPIPEVDSDAAASGDEGAAT